MTTFAHFLIVAGIVAGGVLIGAAILHLVPRLGAAGKRLSVVLCRAPSLDWIITYFTVAPLIIGGIVAGWIGFLGAIVGQVFGVLIWVGLHELAHREVSGKPRIVSALNKIIGPWRNHAALWLTATVTPMFWLVRMVELLAYPPLRWLVGFPRYDSGEWVNVSRHKFKGLVGHDLIWCLYCDWMTGVWSLGSEMLRNVESFWCPIRFDNSKKCQNCSVDFPDINHGWVPAEGDITDAARLIETEHGGHTHAWFGHPVRLTVRGQDLT